MSTRTAPLTYSSLPGPREIFFGTVFRRFSDPISFFEGLANRYGKLARFSLLHEKFLLVCEPELIEEVLIHQQASFHKGRAMERARSFLGNSVLVSEGLEHRRQRKLLQPAFHRERIARYATGMAELAAQWTAERQEGESLDMSVEMNRLTLHIVAGTLFGSQVEQETREIAESLTTIIENFNRMIMPFAHLLRLFPTAGNRKIFAAHSRLDKTVYRMIDERRKDKEDRGDLLSMLLAAEDAESPDKHFSDKEIRDQTMTIFIAGHETTSNALAWTWHLLADPKHDYIWQRMLAEIEQVLGDRQPGLEDVANLIYTRFVFSEAIRLFPPAWATGRRAIEPVMLGELEVPKGVIVIVSPYLMQRDPRFWPDPLEFKPERWLEGKSDRPRMAYFPFGAGPRNCMGESFAWTEALIILATIARKWKFTYNGTKPTLGATMTLRPKGGMPMLAAKSVGAASSAN